MSTPITPINKKSNTPEVLANNIDWAKAKHCVILIKENDGAIRNYHSSNMELRDVALLAAYLQSAIGSGFKKV